MTGKYPNYFTKEELEFLNTECDGKTELSAELTQLCWGNTVILKTANPRRSHFFLESNLIANLWSMVCQKRER